MPDPRPPLGQTEVDGELVVAYTTLSPDQLDAAAVARLEAELEEQNRRRAAAVGQTTELPPGAEMRRVWRPWTRAELLGRWQRAGAACWREGDELVFVHRAEAEAVRLTLGLQCRMWRVAGDLWAVSFRIKRIEEAYVTYAFLAEPRVEGVPWLKPEDVHVWRGPLAPATPTRARRLRGDLHHFEVPSRALGKPRRVHVYRSPGWDSSAQTLVVQAADAAHRAEVIEPLVLSGELPPTVCLGVEFEGGDAGRAAEYLPGNDPGRFDAHMEFQALELPAWTADTLGLDPPRDRRVVTGQSNGGSFAVIAGVRHPDTFGHVLAFSVAGGPPPPALGEDDRPRPRFDLAAGALEGFRRTTTGWRDVLARWGAPVRYDELAFGHDPALWDIAFLRGLRAIAGSAHLQV